VSTGSASTHDWVIRQLLAYGTGMLPEDEMLKLEEHLQSCPDCRSRLAPLKPAAGTSAGHLPASLIATWPRSSRLLEGLERELVEAHLEDCEECRATLRFAGHEPVLAPQPGVVVGHVSARGAVHEPRTQARRAWMWALGLSGAAAGIMAWLLAGHPTSLTGRSDERTSATMGAPGQAGALTFDLAVDSLASGAMRLPEPGFARTSARPIDVGVVTNISGLVLVLPPALQPPTPEAGERQMVIRLMRDGHELASHTGHFYALGDAIRLRPQGRLDAGEYDLAFTLSPAASGEPPLVWIYRLRVR
jgi:hypothetical protein